MTTTATKTIQGITYHQDPTLTTVWYDNPAKIGQPGRGSDTDELAGTLKERDELAKAMVGETDPEAIADADAEIAGLDREIAILWALAG